MATETDLRELAVKGLPYLIYLRGARQQARLQAKAENGEHKMKWLFLVGILSDRIESVEEQIAQEMGLLKFTWKGD